MKLKDKFQSRKFIAWITATVILLYLLFSQSEYFPAFVPWWGTITTVWLGAEGGADIMRARKG